MNMDDAFFERMRIENPAAYKRLMENLPDVRDGLTQQQRSLLVTMKRLGATSDSRMKSTAYISYNTRAVGFEKPPETIRARLTEVKFDDDGREERYYTPDLGL